MVSGGCSHSWRIASSWQQFAMWKVRGCRIRRAERSLSRLRRYGRSGAGHSTFKIRSTRGLSEPRKRFEGQRQRFALQAYPETMTRNVESPAMRPSPEQRAITARRDPPCALNEHGRCVPERTSACSTPPAARSVTSGMAATSQAGSGSQRTSTHRDRPASSGASPGRVHLPQSGHACSETDSDRPRPPLRQQRACCS